MAVSTFKKISWSPSELITDQKMDTINENINFLNNRSVRGRYGAHGVTKIDGTRILSGIATIGATKATGGNRQVNWNGFFSAGCRPIVTTGVTTLSHWHMAASVHGLGQMFPDHRGCVIQLWNATPNKNKAMNKTNYVNYIAMGW